MKVITAKFTDIERPKYFWYDFGESGWTSDKKFAMKFRWKWLAKLAMFYIKITWWPEVRDLKCL